VSVGDRFPATLERKGQQRVGVRETLEPLDGDEHDADDATLIADASAMSAIASTSEMAGECR
jgi:hypothetical protein